MNGLILCLFNFLNCSSKHFCYKTCYPVTHLFTLPPQGGKEVTECADALQLNDKKEHKEDCALH